MEELKRLLSNLTLKQKVSLVAAAAAVVFGLVALSRWNRERDFRPLYTGLAAEDAGAIVARLRENGAEYRLSDNGSTVLVSSAQVAELRLQMANSGLPRSGRIGFELFDKTNFGATDFAEQINYHRALEGELERSVMSLAEVERARVHISLPKESVFLESRRPAKGSVMVKLRPGARLSPQSVLAICHLVASAVEGLEPQAVSVLDMQGNLLNRPRPADDPESPRPSDALLEYRQRMEKDLVLKIHSTLEPLLGPEAFQASVNLDCDFTSGEQSEEIYDPTRSVMTSSQRTEDVSGAPAATGVPGTASTLPRPTSRPGQGARGLTRKTENIAYQSSRLVRRVRTPQGVVKRMSVALLVDHTIRWEGPEGNAKRIVEAPSEDKLKAIRDLVAGAIGLQPDRGDQLIVESLPFDSTQKWKPEPGIPAPRPPTSLPLPSWLPESLKDVRSLAVGVAAVAVILALVALSVFAVMRKRRKKQGRVEPGPRALPAASEESEFDPTNVVQEKMQERLAEQQAFRAKLEEETLKSLKLPAVKTRKSEVLAKLLSEQAHRDPVTMVQLLRTWLNEEGA